MRRKRRPFNVNRHRDNPSLRRDWEVAASKAARGSKPWVRPHRRRKGTRKGRHKS